MTFGRFISHTVAIYFNQQFILMIQSIGRASNSKQQIRLVLAIFLMITAIEVINLLTGRMLNQLGNIPRYVPGLRGIILGPFCMAVCSTIFRILFPCVFSAFYYCNMA